MTPTRVSAHQAGTAYVGTVLFVASWTVLFAGLLFAYGILRQSAPHWPPESIQPLPTALPALATAVVILSSICLFGALRKPAPVAVRRVAPAEDAAHARTPQQNRSRRNLLVLATALGGLFLALQAWVGIGLWLSGLRPSSSTYGAAYYVLTFFHALHVAVGVVALSLVAWRQSSRLRTRLWSLYWHMLGAAWVVLFITVYVV